MANSGFSAPIDYWGGFSGLVAKSSESGYNASVVTAKNAKGDTIAFDRIGGIINPSVEYALTAAFENANNVLALGKVVSYTVSSTTRKLMMTQVVVKTVAGEPPTITVSGVQVENSATTKRTYPVAFQVVPRSKAQDVAGAFDVSIPLHSVETVFAIDPVVATIGGWPTAHDLNNGRIEANATLIQAVAGGTWDKSEDFDALILGDESRQDASYISRNLSAIKYLTGVDA